jgi:hypothetical protein
VGLHLTHDPLREQLRRTNVRYNEHRESGEVNLRSARLLELQLHSTHTACIGALKKVSPHPSTLLLDWKHIWQNVNFTGQFKRRRSSNELHKDWK